MNIMLRAAIAAASFASIGSAYAGDSNGTVANTLFTSLPGVVAQAPAQKAPSATTAQNGQVMEAYATQSSRGTWVFQGGHGGDGTQG